MDFFCVKKELITNVQISTLSSHALPENACFWNKICFFEAKSSEIRHTKSALAA
jgi:hypothetical protein